MLTLNIQPLAQSRVRPKSSDNGLYTTDASRRAFVEHKNLATNSESGNRILSDNRQAGHNYHLLEKYEAGIALSGTEVKAAKTGKVQLKESYADIQDNEAWLLNAHISQYSHGNRENHEADAKTQAACCTGRRSTSCTGR